MHRAPVHWAPVHWDPAPNPRDQAHWAGVCGRKAVCVGVWTSNPGLGTLSWGFTTQGILSLAFAVRVR